MYVASTRPSERVRGRVPGTVVALGAVSLLTDVSAEMITAFMPVYLLFTLQMGYAQFGVLDGVYTGATALLRLVGGHVSDRTHRHKAVAATGYGLSAATKLIFPVVGANAFGIGATMAADRAGKGLRTAPRDALISLSTPPDRLGAAFGLHRSMDTVGALLGPLVTFLLLSQIGIVAGPVFVVSACFAVVGLIVLIAFVRERPVPARTGPKPSIRAGLALLKGAGYRRVAIAAAVLGLATLSDAFVFILVQKATDVPQAVLPLMPLGTALVFLAAAAPLGRLADKVGGSVVFLGGHVLLLAVYVLLLASGTGYVGVGVALLLHGLFYAATDGVLSARVSALVPESLRASGLSVVQTGQALTRLVSSVGFGFLLQFAAFDTAVYTAIGSLVIAVVLAWRMT
ncbi:MFS transporter [Saccharothrix algeriensis]|uniref:MFS family permease n=1 Tax=Saccharothrix algeriensis TaxID=173560 RepID=A0A8T8I303_9PSEU|nr:MFS transporter [Saccharothrix algeriensis]MBM7810189.1 MFS family permease [Saccharothrix algeriensis]QTR04374.1 MFS transporter [Saccharothrix algeriensis]